MRSPGAIRCATRLPSPLRRSLPSVRASANAFKQRSGTELKVGDHLPSRRAAVPCTRPGSNSESDHKHPPSLTSASGPHVRQDATKRCSRSTGREGGRSRGRGRSGQTELDGSLRSRRRRLRPSGDLAPMRRSAPSAPASASPGVRVRAPGGRPHRLRRALHLPAIGEAALTAYSPLPTFATGGACVSARFPPSSPPHWRAPSPAFNLSLRRASPPCPP